MSWDGPFMMMRLMPASQQIRRSLPDGVHIGFGLDSPAGVLGLELGFASGACEWANSRTAGDLMPATAPLRMRSANTDRRRHGWVFE